MLDLEERLGIPVEQLEQRGSDWLAERLAFDNHVKMSDLDYWGARICWTLVCLQSRKGRQPKFEEFFRRPRITSNNENKRASRSGQSFRDMMMDLKELMDSEENGGC